MGKKVDNRQIMILKINPDIHRRFKIKTFLEGKTMTNVIENFMKEYAKGDEDASRTKNSWS